MFEDIGLWDNTSVSVTGTGEPERIQALLVSDGTLPVLRVQPALGRDLQQRGRQARRAGARAADPGLLAAQNGLRSRCPRQVARHRRHAARNHRRAARRIQVPQQRPSNRAALPDSTAPRCSSATSATRASRGSNPGSTLAQANADVARMLPLVIERFPLPNGFTRQMFDEVRLGPNVRPLSAEVIGDIGRSLWVLLGTVGIVLLIACANVANLFLVRAEGRQQELAIHAALGASRGRITWELLSESLALALAGGALGVLLAEAGIRLLIAVAPEGLPRVDEIRIDPVVLGFTAAVSLVAGLLFGLLPVLKFTTPQLASSLKEGGRASSDGRSRHRARNMPRRRRSGAGGGAAGRIRPDDAHLPGDAEGRPRVHAAGTGADAAGVDSRVPRARQGTGGADARADRQAHRADPRRQGRRPLLVHHDGRQRQQRPDLRRGFPGARRTDAAAPPVQMDRRGYFEAMGNRVSPAGRSPGPTCYTQTPVVVVTENFAREYWKSPTRRSGGASARIRRIRGARSSASLATRATTAWRSRRRRSCTGR